MPKPNHLVPFDDAAREHLARVLRYNGVMAARQFEKSLNRIDSEFELANRLGSPRRTQEILDTIAKLSAEFVENGILGIETVKPDRAAFAMIEEASLAFLSSFRSRLPEFAFQEPWRRIRGTSVHLSVAILSFAQARSDLIAKLAIAQFAFNIGPTRSSIRVEPRLPRLPEPKLQTWWRQLGTRCDRMTLTELEAKVRADFPDHTIARERIRALAPGRKRGPKQIR